MPFTTRITLIERIQLGSDIGWADFHQTYRPLMLLRGRDRGLRPDELPDLVQDVLTSFFKGQEKFRYDPTRGRFRDYLKRIIDRRAFDILRKRPRDERSVADLAEAGAVLQSTEFTESEKRWDDAWRKHLLQQAFMLVQREVTETTYQAFEMCVVDEISPKIVADTLHISVASVYVAKHRVLKRLKPIIQRLEEDL